MSLEALPRQLRRERIVPPERPPSLQLGPAAIERMIPHRPPMRLVDGIDAFDAASLSIRGHRCIDPDDPVLAGHFPGTPVYPGALQLEMVGQLGLCLLYLQLQPPAPLQARLLHVHHATFVAPVRPGMRLTLEARTVEHDPLAAVVAGQAWHEGQLCATGVLEVYLV